MTSPVRVAAMMLAGLLLGIGIACAMGQTFEGARRELASMIEPAANAAFSPASPTPVEDADPCQDPFFGPRDGLRPVLSYEASLATIGKSAAELVSAAEEAWREMGLEISPDESEELVTRYAGRDSYNVRIVVNLRDGVAVVEGSGPCVDNPETNSFF